MHSQDRTVAEEPPVLSDAEVEVTIIRPDGSQVALHKSGLSGSYNHLAPDRQLGVPERRARTRMSAPFANGQLIDLKS